MVTGENAGREKGLYCVLILREKVGRNRIEEGTVQRWGPPMAVQQHNPWIFPNAIILTIN